MELYEHAGGGGAVFFGGRVSRVLNEQQRMGTFSSTNSTADRRP